MAKHHRFLLRLHLDHLDALDSAIARIDQEVGECLQPFRDDLARLYRAAAGRFHLPQWTASIERKLNVLDSIYEKLTTRATSLRLELLEIIVIVLIAVSMVTPFIFGH